MIKRRWLFFAIIGFVAIVVAAAALAPRLVDDGVPTLCVHSTPFVRRVTAEGNLKAVRSTPLTTPMRSRRSYRIAWLVPDGSHVAEGDVVVRFDPTDFEKELLDGQADSQIADHQIGKAEARRQGGLRNLDRDAELSRQQLENARQFQNTDSAVYSRMEIIESEIDTDLAEQRTEHAEASKEIQDQLSQTTVDLLAISRHQAELRIEQAQEGLESLQIVAPHDGIVVFERNWRGEIPRVGGNSWPGQPLAQIPELGEMEVEVYVLEADAGGLAEGQNATVVLEAHPEEVFSATVRQLDPIAKPRLRNVPVQYFRTVLALSESDSPLMKPGQRVHAEIVIDQVPTAFVIPRQAVDDSEEGTSIVYLRQGRGFAATEVTLGPSDLGRVVVTTGLAEGDEIALRNPHEDGPSSDGEAQQGAHPAMAGSG